VELLEHETKKILEKHDIPTPSKDGESFVVKAQILEKNRKSKGGIKFAESRKKAERIAEDMKNGKLAGRKVESVLIEEKVDIEHEYYISFVYDTSTRGPVFLFSADGGSGVENREITKFKIEKGSKKEFTEKLRSAELSDDISDRLSIITHLIFNVFLEEDAMMLEVNPLVLDSKKDLIAVDAKMELDNDASFRHNWSYPKRTAFKREKTEREIEAEKIDEEDHRGVAGKYVELEGDIGMMLAGGGASLTNMDSLIAYGGKPANYTEYGGNPPTEKVYRLSKVIMSKPNLKGLLHVGGTANNTDIYRTMRGFCQALEEEEPEYPIVIRRDGPNAEKAFELLEKTREKLDLNMNLYRNDLPMTESSKKLMDMIKSEDSL